MNGFINRENKGVFKHRVNIYADMAETPDSLEGIASGLLEKKQTFESATGEKIPIEQDPSVLKNMIGNDIRDSVPPKVYGLIAEIVSAIEEIEEDEWGE